MYNNRNHQSDRSQPTLAETLFFAFLEVIFSFPGMIFFWWFAGQFVGVILIVTGTYPFDSARSSASPCSHEISASVTSLAEALQAERRETIEGIQLKEFSDSKWSDSLPFDIESHELERLSTFEWSSIRQN